jgi:hypothetical protein
MSLFGLWQLAHFWVKSAEPSGGATAACFLEQPASRRLSPNTTNKPQQRSRRCGAGRLLLVKEGSRGVTLSF